MTKNELRESVAALLSGWAGYETVHAYMKKRPELRAHLYGGSIRNLILGRTAQKDLDIFIEASALDDLPDELAKRGTVHVGVFKHITWYPEGGGGARWDLQVIPKMETGVWPCENIVDVLGGVDFTGNAIAYDLKTGELVDPQNGHRDMCRRVMRGVRFDRREVLTCGTDLPFPATIWFRIIHYTTLLGLKVEPVTARWLLEHRRYETYLETFASMFFTPQLGALHQGGLLES